MKTNKIKITEKNSIFHHSPVICSEINRINFYGEDKWQWQWFNRF